MRKLVIIKRIKDNNNINLVYTFLKNNNIKVENFFKHLKEYGKFEFYIDKEILDSIIKDLSNLAEIEINDTSQTEINKRDYGINNQINSPFSFFVLSFLDIFIVLTFIEITFKILNLDYLILNYLGENLSHYFIIILKLAFSFVYIKGFLDFINSTPIGYLFKVKIYGSQTNIISTFLTPIIGFYLIKLDSNTFKLLGLFLIVFYIVSVFVTFKYLSLSLERDKDL